MSFLDRVKTELRRVLSLRDPQHWRNNSTEAPSGESVSETSVLALSAAWACVNLLAGTISSLPVVLDKPGKVGGWVEVDDHPLARILQESPNADDTALDFWEVCAAALELRGNFHAQIARGAGGRIVALTPILADVTARRNERGEIVYSWSSDGRSYRDVAAAEIFHVRGFGGSPLGGLSTIACGRHVFGLAQAIDRAAGATFGNGLRPSGVLTLPGVLKAEQRTEIEQGLQNKFAGAARSGVPMVLEGGTKWEQLSIKPEDAQMLESRGFSVEEICRLFGVPPFMIGHTEKTTSWGSGLEQQIIGFQIFTLRRRLKRIEQAIRKQLLTADDRARGIRVKFDLRGLLRGDSAARAAFYQSALQNGWMTVNEVRELEGLPPVAGGDVPRVQSQNVPLTLTVAPAQLGHNGGPPLDPAA